MAIHPILIKANLKAVSRHALVIGGIMFDFFSAKKLKAERDEARAEALAAGIELAAKLHEMERLSKLNRTYAESARRALDLLTAISDVVSAYNPDGVDKLQNNKSLKAKLSEAQRIIETVSKVAKSEGA